MGVGLIVGTTVSKFEGSVDGVKDDGDVVSLGESDDGIDDSGNDVVKVADEGKKNGT